MSSPKILFQNSHEATLYWRLIFPTTARIVELGSPICEEQFRPKLTPQPTARELDGWDGCEAPPGPQGPLGRDGREAFQNLVPLKGSRESKGREEREERGASVSPAPRSGGVVNTRWRSSSCPSVPGTKAISACQLTQNITSAVQGQS